MTKTLFLFFISIIVIYGCSNSTVRDYTTLKQKALEIPPEFDLIPPKEGRENVDEKVDTPSASEDLEDILGQSTDGGTSMENSKQSLDEFIDQKFLGKKNN